MEFKDNKDKELFFNLHPILIMIVANADLFLQKKGHDLIITDTISTIEEDKRLNRKSDSHRLGIAIDFRTYNLDSKIKKELKEFLEKKYHRYKYLTYSGKHQLIYYHDNGNGEHGHLQIHKKYITSLDD